MTTKYERDFQRELVKDIEHRFNGCIVTKLDAKHKQGIPDLLVLYKDRWATLECKRDEKTASKESGRRPNQERWVKKMNTMSFSRIIFPENKEEVLYDLNRHFKK